MSWTKKIKNSNQLAHPNVTAKKGPTCGSSYINTVCSLHFLFPPSRAAIALPNIPSMLDCKRHVAEQKN